MNKLLFPFIAIAIPLVGCSSPLPSSAAPSPASSTKPVGQISPVVPYGYGICYPIEFPPAQYKLFHDGGFGLSRNDFFWQDIEKTPGVYDFSRYDKQFVDMEKLGVRPVWILDYTNTNYDNNQPPHTAAGIAGYANFAKAAAAHFKNRGVIWEIWNEPNEPNFWQTGPNADQYAALVKATVPAIRSADPKATILGGAISQFNIPYILAFLKAQPLAGVTAFSIHPYREGQPETVISDYAKVRALIAKYAPPGQSLTPIACSEWGYTTSVGQNTEAEQARYLTRMYLTNLLCGVNMTNNYNWFNDGSDPASDENRYGILREDLTPKPAYTALSALLNTLRGYQFRHRIRQTRSADYKLLFQNADKLALVTWTSDAAASEDAQTPHIAMIGKGNASYASLMRLAVAKNSPDDRPYPDVLPNIPGVVTSLTSTSAPLPPQNAAPPSGTDALANGSYEAGTAGWVPSSLEAGQRLGITKAVSRTGSMSAFMSADPKNEASYFNWSQTATAVKPGEKYTFTGWLKKEDVHGPAGYFIHVNGPNGTVVLNNTLTSQAGYSKGWDKVTSTFTIPEGGQSITIGTNVYGTGVAYFDDASLVKGGSDDATPGSATAANSGFETGDTTPAGWAVDNADATHHLSLTKDDPHSGKQSAKMVADAGVTSSYFSFDQYIHVTPGAYTFTAWVKADKVQGSAGWFYHVYKGHDIVVNNTLNVNNALTGWSQVTATITVPEGGDAVQIGTSLYGTGTAYFGRCHTHEKHLSKALAYSHGEKWISAGAKSERLEEIDRNDNNRALAEWRSRQS